jgi:hypothetical protein
MTQPRSFRIGILAAVWLIGAAAASFAETSSHLQLQRDSLYEQSLHYQASADTAITPARVIRWLDTLMGHTPRPSNSPLEFQPVVRANEHRNQLIAQIAYKF